MSIFGKGKQFSRLEIRRSLRKSSSVSVGGRMFSRQERVKLEKELFPHRKYGSHISETEAKTALRGLRKSEYQAKTGKEKLKFTRQKRLLEKITDLKGKY